MMKIRAVFLTIFFLALAALSGCTSHRPLRSVVEVCDPETGALCDAQSLVRTDDYLLGIVEYDDHGWFWDVEQMDRLLEEVERIGTEHELMMVVFAHGWKHNAAPSDTNLHDFQQVLEDLADDERQLALLEERPARRVVALYLTWRGLSVTPPVLKEFSFWSRKATSHKVGSAAGVSELLVRLDRIRGRQRALQKPTSAKTRLVIIGHSFGAALIYSSVSPLLPDRFIPPPDKWGRERIAESFGDMIVLINPAWEAARFHNLHTLSVERTRYASGQQPILMILTSEADNATKIAFPLGRFFSTFFTKHRRNVNGVDQLKANRRAVGHFKPYETHVLCTLTSVGRDAGSSRLCDLEAPTTEEMASDLADLLSDEPAEGTAVVSDKARRRVEEIRDAWETVREGAQWRHVFGDSLLAHRSGPPLNPFLVVTVDKALVPNHSEIWGEDFTTFLRLFIAAGAP